MDATSYSGSLLATLTVAAVAGIAWCVRTKMKHSKCALNSPCLKITSQEDDLRKATLREEILEELRKDGILNTV